jgi:Na+-translocating ferredoxin:NAD+ oxidoreductase RnfG subunit
MPTGIVQAFLSAISGIFSAINNVFGAKNTKEMKDRDQARKEVEYQNQIEQEIKEKDLEKIRKRIGS